VQPSFNVNESEAMGTLIRVVESRLEEVSLRRLWKEFRVWDERIEKGRAFRMVGAAMWKE